MFMAIISEVLSVPQKFTLKTEVSFHVNVIAISDLKGPRRLALMTQWTTRSQVQRRVGTIISCWLVNNQNNNF